MRLVIYNIRYGAGSGASFHLPLPYSGYLKRNPNNLDKIINFFRCIQPDIIGLVEVDQGSYRTRKSDQAEQIAESLNFEHVYESKYGPSSFARHMPVMKKQGNALLTNQRINTRSFHYFQEGVKRLVIELELDSCVIFLVHLSIKYRHRQSQLADLHSMFAGAEKPVIVAGDFNFLWGDRELDCFLTASGLKNADRQRKSTYPSWAPRRPLDFILHSPRIRVTDFFIPQVLFSDHMPLVCDFEIAGGSMK